MQGVMQALRSWGDSVAYGRRDRDMPGARWQAKLAAGAAFIWVSLDPPLHCVASQSGTPGRLKLWWCRAVDGPTTMGMVDLLLAVGGVDSLVIDAACLLTAAQLRRQWPVWMRAAHRQKITLWVCHSDRVMQHADEPSIILTAYPRG